MKWATCDGPPCLCTLLIGNGTRQPIDCTACKFRSGKGAPSCFMSSVWHSSLLMVCTLFPPQWSPSASWWKLKCTELEGAWALALLEESNMRPPLWTTMASMTLNVRMTANSRPSSATTQMCAGASTALESVELTRETRPSSVRSWWRPSKWFHYSEGLLWGWIVQVFNISLFYFSLFQLGPSSADTQGGAHQRE